MSSPPAHPWCYALATALLGWRHDVPLPVLLHAHLCILDLLLETNLILLQENLFQHLDPLLIIDLKEFKLHFLRDFSDLSEIQ